MNKHFLLSTERNCAFQLPLPCYASICRLGIICLHAQHISSWQHKQQRIELAALRPKCARSRKPCEPIFHRSTELDTLLPLLHPSSLMQHPHTPGGQCSKIGRSELHNVAIVHCSHLLHALVTAGDILSLRCRASCVACASQP